MNGQEARVGVSVSSRLRIGAKDHRSRRFERISLGVWRTCCVLSPLPNVILGISEEPHERGCSLESDRNRG